MDERGHVFLCAVCGVALFGLLGALFGGLVGWVAEKHGHGSGGWFGATVLHSLERIFGKEVPPRTAAVVNGVVEGAVFLGVVGGVLGLAVGHFAARPLPLMLTLSLAAGLLSLGAVVFGGLAYLTVRVGGRAVGLGIALGAGGAWAGAALAGEDGLIGGAVAGLAVGILTAAALTNSPPPSSPGDVESSSSVWESENDREDTPGLQ